ncbi:MAG: extracellular solute-binding protein [Deltaproteobacteria bacterium]|nr:extracellular solute-binding protein [Deltaproteobacteria bacterium]
MKRLFVFVLGVSFPALAASPREVVVYSSVDDVFARPIAEKFERETGIKVKLVPDTEETKSTGLLNRLIAEKARPQADVFWSGDPVRAAILKSKGVTASYRSPQAKGLPRLFSDPEGHWTGFSSRARIILFNKNAVAAQDAPTSVKDLASPKFKGKTCIANPLFGTTSMHAAALFQAIGDEEARKLLDAMAANEIQVLSSNGEVRRRVSSGDCSFGVTDTDDAFEAVHDGKPVGVVFPDEKGMGTLLVPNAAVLIAGAPHADAAKQFIDYLLSPGTEKALAESDAAQMPVRRGVKAPSHVRPIEKIKPMKVDYAKLAPKLEELSHGFLKQWVEKTRH